MMFQVSFFSPFLFFYLGQNRHRDLPFRSKVEKRQKKRITLWTPTPMDLLIRQTHRFPCLFWRVLGFSIHWSIAFDRSLVFEMNHQILETMNATMIWGKASLELFLLQNAVSYLEDNIGFIPLSLIP